MCGIPTESWCLSFGEESRQQASRLGRHSRHLLRRASHMRFAAPGLSRHVFVFHEIAPQFCKPWGFIQKIPHLLHMGINAVEPLTQWFDKVRCYCSLLDMLKLKQLISLRKRLIKSPQKLVVVFAFSIQTCTKNKGNSGHVWTEQRLSKSCSPWDCFLSSSSMRPRVQGHKWCYCNRFANNVAASCKKVFQYLPMAYVLRWSRQGTK